MAREFKSIGTMKKELADLQEELSETHKEVHVSEARIADALDKLAYMEAVVNERLLPERSSVESSSDYGTGNSSTSAASMTSLKPRSQRRSLSVSGPVHPYHPNFKNFWYPVTFSSDLKDDTMIPIDCFEETWVIFRGKGGKPGCLQNSCAHRACALHLGSVNKGRIQCAYHGQSFHK